MKIPRFDMAAACREALRIFSESGANRDKAKIDAQWATLKQMATKAMDACDRRNEEERADFEGLMLFLCAIADFEKYQQSDIEEERSRLFLHATRKLNSARYNYERA